MKTRFISLHQLNALQQNCYLKAIISAVKERSKDSRFLKSVAAAVIAIFLRLDTIQVK